MDLSRGPNMRRPQCTPTSPSSSPSSGLRICARRPQRTGWRGRPRPATVLRGGGQPARCPRSDLARCTIARPLPSWFRSEWPARPAADQSRRPGQTRRPTTTPGCASQPVVSRSPSLAAALAAAAGLRPPSARAAATESELAGHVLPARLPAEVAAGQILQRHAAEHMIQAPASGDVAEHEDSLA
jgi:hypothetical protein